MDSAKPLNFVILARSTQEEGAFGGDDFESMGFAVHVGHGGSEGSWGSGDGGHDVVPSRREVALEGIKDLFVGELTVRFRVLKRVVFTSWLGEYGDNLPCGCPYTSTSRQ